MAVEMQPLVLDIGSGIIKAGFAGDSAPTTIFPTIICRSKMDVCIIGTEAQSSRNLRRPVERGIVSDWDDMEKILSHTFDKELNIKRLDQHPVLCTEAPLNPRKNREKMAEIMFETFHVPAFFVAIPGVLSLHATGRETGIVIDSGDGVTYVVHVYDSYVNPGAICRVDIAGSDITDVLVDQVDKKYSFTANSKREIVRDMKEKLGYVAFDYNKELIAAAKPRSGSGKRYELPDGQVMTLDVERFKCTEVLFDPSLLSIDAPGVHQLLFYSLANWDEDDAIRKALWSNILVTGGSTMFPGFVDRLSKEITQPGLTTVKVEEVAHPLREYAAWVGGSIVASLSIFPQMCISREVYNEVGSSIICNNITCPWIEPSAVL